MKEKQLPTMLEDISIHPVVGSLRPIKFECKLDCRQRQISGGFESLCDLLMGLGLGKADSGAYLGLFQRCPATAEGATSGRLMMAPNRVLGLVRNSVRHCPALRIWNNIDTNLNTQSKWEDKKTTSK